jgi:hypothetical protein
MGAKSGCSLARDGRSDVRRGPTREPNKANQESAMAADLNQPKFAVLRPETPRDWLRLGPRSCPPIPRGGTSDRLRRPQQRSFPKIMLSSSRLLNWLLRNCTRPRSACACHFWMQKAAQKGGAAGKCQRKLCATEGSTGSTTSRRWILKRTPHLDRKSTASQVFFKERPPFYFGTSERESGKFYLAKSLFR